MELNLRTVLVVVAAIVMLGILIDGFRRMKRARQEALKLDVKQDFQFPEDGFSSELPNGGARVIGTREADELIQEAKHFREQLDDLPGMSALDEVENKALHELDSDIQESLHEERIYAGEPDFQHESYQHADDEENGEPLLNPSALEQVSEVVEEVEGAEEIAKLASADEVKPVELNAQDEDVDKEYASEQLVPKAKPLNLDEHVPLLMDVEELGEELDVAHIQQEVVNPEEEAEQLIELTQDDIAGIQASVSEIADLSVGVGSNSETDTANLRAADRSKGSDGSEDVALDVDSSETAHLEEDHMEEDGRQQAEDMMAQAAYAPVKKPGANAESLTTRPVPSLVLVTHVVPHDEDGFCGEDILYLVNSCDLRHGEKDIFHRFEKENGEGRVQFSMANSFNPGTFNPETLLHERIHGVSLFMSLPGPDKAMDAFEAMTEMASVIARNLGGDVHDETHSIMALQTIEHNRQQVRDFVRKQKLAQKK